MATSEEYIQSILTGIGTVKNHKLRDEQAVNDILKDIDDLVTDVVDELDYLDEDSA